MLAMVLGAVAFLEQFSGRWAAVNTSNIIVAVGMWSQNGQITLHAAWQWR